MGCEATCCCGRSLKETFILFKVETSLSQQTTFISVFGRPSRRSQQEQILLSVKKMNEAIKQTLTLNRFTGLILHSPPAETHLHFHYCAIMLISKSNSVILKECLGFCH